MNLLFSQKEEEEASVRNPAYLISSRFVIRVLPGSHHKFLFQILSNQLLGAFFRTCKSEIPHLHACPFAGSDNAPVLRM